ncbi:nucleolar protein 8 [Blomia tropicalis]|nr:nucleolar protein 8 [Blomia tropicalis]
MDSSNKKPNLSLFEDDDDDNNVESYQNQDEYEDFKLKIDEKLKRGEKSTSKLIELQSKFSYDSRFKIDDRFVDIDDEDHLPVNEIEEEKSKNIAILEQVLGKHIHSSKPIDPVSEYRNTNKNAKKLKHNQTTLPASVLTPRFDPLKEESKVYEISNSSTLNKRKVNIDFDLLDQKEKESNKKAKTIVPSETEKLVDNYYEVASNLKDTLAGTEGFSLGSFLGLNSQDEEQQYRESIATSNEKATFEPISKLEKKKLKTLKNPFKYDSSDEDDDLFERSKWNDMDFNDFKYDDNDVDNQDIQQKAKQKTTKVDNSIPILSEFKFFMKPEDARLKVSPFFYSDELISKSRANGKQRSVEMMKALSFRRYAAQKNSKTTTKFIEKRKLLSRMGKGKRRHFHRHYSKNKFGSKRSSNRKEEIKQ